jgi:hypothetical protein
LTCGPEAGEKYLYKSRPPLCLYHYQKSKPKRKPVSKIRKSTGEKALFEEIWNERPRECFVCKEPIYEFHPVHFSHILSKGSHVKFRLNKENILLKCRQHHHDWDFAAKSDLIKDERWQPVFDLAERLKRQYNQR